MVSVTVMVKVKVKVKVDVKLVPDGVSEGRGADEVGDEVGDEGYGPFVMIICSGAEGVAFTHGAHSTLTHSLARIKRILFCLEGRI